MVSIRDVIMSAIVANWPMQWIRDAIGALQSIENDAGEPLQDLRQAIEEANARIEPRDDAGADLRPSEQRNGTQI